MPVKYIADGGLYNAVYAQQSGVVAEIFANQPSTCPATLIQAATSTAATAVASATVDMTAETLYRPPGPFDWYWLLLENIDVAELKSNLSSLFVIFCIVFTLGWIALWLATCCCGFRGAKRTASAAAQQQQANHPVSKQQQPNTHLAAAQDSLLYGFRPHGD